MGMNALVGDIRYFQVTEDHIKLLRRANVSWEHCEYGAPAIDCKRPYGNSYVAMDIAEILGWDWPDQDDFSGGYEEYQRITEEIEDRARQLHQETETVLQIILTTGRMEPGIYWCRRYHRDWRLNREEPAPTV